MEWTVPILKVSCINICNSNLSAIITIRSSDLSPTGVYTDNGRNKRQKLHSNWTWIGAIPERRIEWALPKTHVAVRLHCYLRSLRPRVGRLEVLGVLPPQRYLHSVLEWTASVFGSNDRGRGILFELKCRLPSQIVAQIASIPKIEAMQPKTTVLMPPGPH